VEFFVWLRRGEPQIGSGEIEQVVRDTVGLVPAGGVADAVEDERLEL